jgi:hypothetical protein
MLPSRSGMNGSARTSRTRPRTAYTASGLSFARFGNLDLGTPSRNRANVAVAKDASRSGIMAFCRRRCRLFRELHHSRASIVLARLYNVRRGGNFGNSPKRTEGVASAGEHPPVAK